MADLRKSLVDTWLVMAVNVGESRERVEEFAQEVGWADIMQDPEGKLAKMFSVYAYPTTVLVTSSCQLVMIAENQIPTFAIMGGRKWNAPDMVKFFVHTAAQMHEKPSH